MVAAVVWLSLTPAPPRVELDQGDKLGHLFAYGGLMFWFSQLYSRRVALAIAFAAMGIALEFAQGATGYRSFELLDMGANTLGVLLGWAAALLIKSPLLR